jgi:hypothetical protein
LSLAVTIRLTPALAIILVRKASHKTLSAAYCHLRIRHFLIPSLIIIEYYFVRAFRLQSSGL